MGTAAGVAASAAAHNDGFSRSADEASSAAAMLKTLKRLNSGVAGASVGGGNLGGSSDSGDTSAADADVTASVLLPKSAPFRPGDFYLFDVRRFRYLHRRPLLLAPLSSLQLMAEATLTAAQAGTGPYLVGPLGKKRWMYPGKPQ